MSISHMAVSGYGTERGLAHIEDCVNVLIQELRDYIEKSQEKLVTAAKNTIGINTFTLQ